MEKREVPKVVQGILKFDASLTNVLCNLIDKFIPPAKFENHFQALEFSCHGIPWIVLWMAFIWIIWDPSLFQMQVNFFVGLMLDILAIVVIKAFVRRRRPAGSKPNILVNMGPDKYSFPSGHASRCMYITCFFTWLYPLGPVLLYALWAWAVSVAVSRLLMRRHHFLDVAAGLLLGLVETYIVAQIWLSESKCNWLVTWLSDEKLDGGE